MGLKRNLDDVIHEKLNEEIICGNWIPGQLLAPDDLAEHFGVSRTPVLQALKRMNALGMITVTKGHFYVPVFSESQVSDLLRIRLLLETYAIDDLERKSRQADIDTLKALSRACVKYNNAEEIVKTRKTDLDFHRVLVSQAGNQYLNELYAKIQGQFMIANYLLAVHTVSQQQVAADDHEHIVNALFAKEYALAKQILVDHIADAEEKLLIKMR